MWRVVESRWSQARAEAEGKGLDELVREVLKTIRGERAGPADAWAARASSMPPRSCAPCRGW